jgi:hypothetical protein
MRGLDKQASGPNPFLVVDGPAADPGEAVNCSAFELGESLVRFPHGWAPQRLMSVRRILSRFSATCGYPTKGRFGRQRPRASPQPSTMAGAALTRYDARRERAGGGDEEALQSGQQTSQSATGQGVEAEGPQCA